MTHPATNLPAPALREIWLQSLAVSLAEQFFADIMGIADFIIDHLGLKTIR